MQRAAVGLAWVSVAASLAGFVLPWVTVGLRGVATYEDAGRLSRMTLQIRRGTETVAGSLLSGELLPRRVSGVQIPGLAQQEDMQVVVALMELLANTPQHAVLKSYAVFLVPGVALLCGLLLMGWSDRPAVAGGVMALCTAVAAVGSWKLLTVDPARSVVAVTIGWGLWLSVGAYVGLAAAALMGLVGGEST
jgi:hypothetical protein